MKKEKTLTRGSLLCTNILISSPYLEVEYIFYFCVTFIYFYYFAFWIYLFNDMGRTSGCFGTPINNNYIIKCSGASLQAGFFFPIFSEEMGWPYRCSRQCLSWSTPLGEEEQSIRCCRRRGRKNRKDKEDGIWGWINTVMVYKDVFRRPPPPTHT